MAIEKLTARRVTTLAQRGYHNDGGGLYLRVGESGNKSWVFRYKIAGNRTREMGLGALYTVSLAEARKRAAKARLQRLDGIDPIAERRRERQVSRTAAAPRRTFKMCAEAYIEVHRAGWRNPVHASQWPNTLRDYVYPIIGALPVAAVETAQILKILQQDTAKEGQPPAPLWTAKPETASRVRGRIEAILAWAAAQNYRKGDNPSRWRGHLDALLPARNKVATVRHHTALPYGELPGFMDALRQEGSISALALEFTVLCASRTGEVLGAQWGEFDLDRGLWLIPGARMKPGRPHRVTLSGAARAVLYKMAALQGGVAAANPAAFVFPGNKPGTGLSQMAMLMLLRRSGRGDLTVHGFRSAFSDWCAEQTDFPSEVREMALAHVVGDKVEAAYRRGDLLAKRYAVAEAWAEYCAGRGIPGHQAKAAVGGIAAAA